MITVHSNNTETIDGCSYLFIFCADLFRIMETANHEEKKK